MVLEITDNNFEVLLFNNTKPVVLDFWAQWCGPCRMVSASIDVMAKEYGEQIVIGKVDVDLNPVLASKFGVRSMPTVLYLKNGEVVNKQVGSTLKSVLVEKLQTIL